MKKIISIFLALVIIMTAIPIAPVPVAGRVVSDTDDEEEYIYYTGVKTYDTPITMCVKSEKAIIYKNLYDTAGQMEILREVKKNTKIQVTGEGKKGSYNKCHPVKDPFWDTEDLDGSDIPTDEKVRGDAIRLQEEKERTGAIQVKEKKIVFINTGMLSLSESDIIDFSVPELYQGGERVEYNWRKIKWTCSNKKILKIKKSGEIVPKKEGKTYIKAVYKGQKIKIPVEVISPDLEMSNYKNNKQKHIITMTFKNNSSNDIKIDFSDLDVYGSAYDKYEDAIANISFGPRIIGEEEVLLHPEEKKKISFTYQPLKKRKINEGTIYFDIKYKGYDIDVMGINTDVSVYIYTLKDEL